MLATLISSFSLWTTTENQYDSYMLMIMIFHSMTFWAYKQWDFPFKPPPCWAAINIRIRLEKIPIFLILFKIKNIMLQCNLFFQKIDILEILVDFFLWIFHNFLQCFAYQIREAKMKRIPVRSNALVKTFKTHL